MDLDQNGVGFTTLGKSTAYFDIDNDGFRELVDWTSQSDGFLTLDKNHNGMIDNLQELFGSSDTDGFSALSSYDADQNYLIDDKDAVFNQLEVWVDKNSDGTSQSSELHSLLSLGIKSIDLRAVQVDQDRSGTKITHTSLVTFNDGKNAEIVAAWLPVDQLLTSYHLPENFEITTAVVGIPFLKGYGNVTDLFVAATLDAELLSQVDRFMKGVWGGAMQVVYVPSLMIFYFNGREQIQRTSKYEDRPLMQRECIFLSRYTGRNYQRTL